MDVKLNKGEKLNVKLSENDIVEKTVKKTVKGDNTPATSEGIVKNILD